MEKKGKKMKKLITLSAIAALTTSSLLAADVDAKISEMEAKITKLEEKLQVATKTLAEVKAHDATDNIKFNVDFRTSVDNITYKLANGGEAKNPDLLTNRLWLNMGFAPNENTLFKGKLSYLKAYGDSPSHSQSNIDGAMSLQTFDWITNENATDNTLKVKEAYWLYMNDTFMGNQVPWTISIGRRPSTDGLGINMREAQKENSPLSHTVNVEFDGLSAKFDLDKVTGVKGMWWKLCTGRGITNAKPRFQMDGTDYAADSTKTKDNNMYGFIFVPYDDGQYSVWTNWAKAEHMIGFDMMSNGGNGDYATWSPVYNNFGVQIDSSISGYKFKDFGDLELATAMFKAEGIGSEINDFLDDTKFFFSVAQSKTKPGGDMNRMLGSTDSKTGTSTWIGVNMPCLLTKDGRIGLEWNKGSKYWRSVTHGEDTMIGSKIAARGTAVEAYYTKPINKALSFDLRYTKIDYDYAGSNMFFGDEGNPDGPLSVTEATNLRASVSYRF